MDVVMVGPNQDIMQLQFRPSDDGNESSGKIVITVIIIVVIIGHLKFAGPGQQSIGACAIAANWFVHVVNKWGNITLRRGATC